MLSDRLMCIGSYNIDNKPISLGVKQNEKVIKPKIKIRKEIGYARHFMGDFTKIPHGAKIFAEWEE